MCLKFTKMERDLGEIDRARAIYSFASQLYDPRTSPHFWTKWEGFEIQHGNEGTFKEILRMKRSVQAQYNTDVNFIASEALARVQARPGRWIKGSVGKVVTATGTEVNPDSIDWDMDGSPIGIP